MHTDHGRAHKPSQCGGQCGCVVGWVEDVVVDEQDCVVLQLVDEVELPQQNDVREDDVIEKSAIEWLQEEYHKRGEALPSGIFQEAKQMELKAKENTYTEEQVRKAIEKAIAYYTDDKLHPFLQNKIIQSLKQPK